MNWGRWPTAAVALGLCAWSTTLRHEATSFFIAMGGVVFATLVMIDFARLATTGVFSTVERTLEIEGKTLRVDGVVRSSPIRDVRVLSEALPRDGGEICRVYLVLDEEIVTLESTTNRLVALRLGSLVREACGLSDNERTRAEIPTAPGCVWSALFYVIACLGPLGISPFAVWLQTPAQKIALSAALIVGLVALEHLFALPMRSALGEHVRRNLRT